MSTISPNAGTRLFRNAQACREMANDVIRYLDDITTYAAVYPVSQEVFAAVHFAGDALTELAANLELARDEMRAAMQAAQAGQQAAVEQLAALTR